MARTASSKLLDVRNDEIPIHLLTLGCSKNRVDSEVMLGQLVQKGYRLEQDPSAAEVILVNTCAFIGEAKQESVNAILEMAEHKKSGKCKTLIVTGCLTQRYAEELGGEMPEVDHFLGTGAYAQVGDVLAAEAAPRQVIPDPEYIHDSKTPRINSMPGYTAYLKISEGCDNKCAFCIIPKLRGGQRSRSIEDIVAEAKTLASQGVVELNLIAQDLTAYGQDQVGRPKLHQLLKALCDQVDVKWIRLHYAYPRDFPDALIDVIANEPKIAKYIDMPIQHASDKLLRSMKRGRDVAFLESLLGKLRSRIPNLVMRTTFIVGMPGETEEDFLALETFVKKHRFERVGVFEYSNEEGTAAAEMDGQLPAAIKRKRRQRLMAVQRKINREQNRKLIGQKVQVLVEGASEETEHLLVGRTEGQSPDIDGIVYINDGLAYPGEIVTLEVTQTADYDLVGHVVAREESKPVKPRKPILSVKLPITSSLEGA